MQEAHDCALVAQVATLESRVPFLHFFDGFRTSHELNTLELLDDSVLRSMIDNSLVRAHRARALNPEHPFVRGTAHNSDTFFQAREAVNPYYVAVPGIVAKAFDRLGALTGRHYRLFEYEGAPDAERVLILMGSGAETARETVKALVAAGEKVGAIQIRLYRPFSAEHLLAVLPDFGAPHRRAGADQRARGHRRSRLPRRGRHPGDRREPRHASGAAAGRWRPLWAGEQGLPACAGQGGTRRAEGGFAATWLYARHRRRCHPSQSGAGSDRSTSTSHPSRAPSSTAWARTARWAPTRTRSRSSARTTGLFAQGYFVYDSHKSGAQTISHLRFGPEPIHAPYLITRAGFVACHKFDFLERLDVLRVAAPGATFLLNAPYGPEEVWDRLPRLVQQQIIDKKLQFHVIDASRAARELGLGARVNTILQTCFFALSGVLAPGRRDRADQAFDRGDLRRKGPHVVQMNMAAVDGALERLHEVAVPARSPPRECRSRWCRSMLRSFIHEVTAKMFAGLGDDIPVSKMPVDGTFPSGTTAYEKRNVSDTVSEWRPGPLHPMWSVQLRVSARRDPFTLLLR